MPFDIANALIWPMVFLAVAVTFLPLTKLPQGAIQGLGFLRIQTLVLTILTALVVPFVMEGAYIWWALGLLTIAGLTNAGYIAKFTPLWPVQSIKPEPHILDLQDRSVTILTINVKMSNRAYDRFLAMVETEQPDILIAVEVDDGWMAGISSIRGMFSDHVDVPLDNGYGMLVWSRLPLGDPRVAYMVTEGVPSIRVAVQLRSKAWFRLFAVHPEPPVPIYDTKGRDSEIALAGIEAKADALPAIVTGDLNDVAWSSTTRRFQRLSGLLDPRVGRGFYATFNALYPFFRWPLDHLFHDPKFRLIEMRRLPHIGSDHFPIQFKLALTPFDGDSVVPDAAYDIEHEEVADMIVESQAQDREPIGSDWEKKLDD